MGRELEPDLRQGFADELVSGFVLAGGRSSRMGSDKALVRFRERPLIGIALATMHAAGIAARIAGARSPLESYALVIVDQDADIGPLGGIRAALKASASRLNLFLPVDMPLMPPSLLRSLVERAMFTGSQVTLLRLNGILQPFPVVLDRAGLPIIERRLAARQRNCRGAWESICAEAGGQIDALAVEVLRAVGGCVDPRDLPPVFWFQSANTPEEVAWLDRVVDDRVAMNLSRRARPLARVL